MKQCEECGVKLTGKKTRFCSQECRNKVFHKELLERMNSGDSNDTHPTVIKRYLMSLVDRVCSICKIATWQNQPVPLIMDHINGNGYDNRLENLRLVCPNCDAQLPTFKARNKGKGRSERRKRYAEGKTY